MTPKYKYTVLVNTINFDFDGQVNPQSFTYEFSSGTLIDMRNAALEKVNDMNIFFRDEMPKNQQFDSPFVAKQKKYRNTNGYSIDVFFCVDNLQYQIIGDEDFQEEGQEAEAHEFKRMNLILV